MQQRGLTLAPFYQGWREYQQLLSDALAPLSAEQLALHASPGQRPIWLLAAHVIGTRIGWFQTWMGEGGPELAPSTSGTPTAHRRAAPPSWCKDWN